MMKTLEEVCADFIRDKDRHQEIQAETLLKISAVGFGQVYEGDVLGIKLVSPNESSASADIMFHTMESNEFANGTVSISKQLNIVPLFLYIAATYAGYSDADVLISHLNEIKDTSYHQYEQPYSFDPVRDTFIRVLKALNKNLTEEGKLWLEFNE
jgi:hypothetical protein